MGRVVSWFSCGIASAVATKLAIASGKPVTIYNCELVEEHPDNARFLRDCEAWFGQKIHIVGNDDYGRSTDEVFRKTRFLVGPSGARCTAELKKAVRWEYGKPDDTVVMGYTVEEQHRVDRLQKSEPLLQQWPILIERGLTKEDCSAIVQRAGVELPEMYKLGYRNNNCIGCVKGQAGYWNKIRRDFPERFAEMAGIERELGRQICKREWTDESGQRQLERIYLDELPLDLGEYEAEQEAQCGIFCHMAEQEIAA
jgi:3'-phosphoadenosine 5'-phosphosulfate sulfotransferase (PAPS reductase)/FAD synthetase